MRFWTALGLVGALAASGVQAEQVATKTYTTADGLARDSVRRIVSDPRGFLWFCTSEGLSRFDGYRFVNYGTDRGLPHPWVSDLLVTRRGDYWVATGGGPVRFDPTGGARLFGPLPPKAAPTGHAFALMEDRAGVVWLGAMGGLFRLQEDADGARWVAVDVGTPLGPSRRPGDPNHNVLSLLEDRAGGIWAGTSADGLFHRRPQGRWERYAIHGLPQHGVNALHEDASGGLWAGTSAGLVRLVAHPDPSQTIVQRVYTVADGLPNDWVNVIFRSAEGRTWCGTRRAGLGEIVFAADAEPRVRTALWLPELTENVRSISQDRDGALWIGSESSGAIKLPRNGFTSYSMADGLRSNRIGFIFEDRNGDVAVVNHGGILNHFDGQRFVPRVVPAPPGTSYHWFGGQSILQDRHGEWWLASMQGLFRFPATAGLRQIADSAPRALYTSRQGLGGNEVVLVHEDAAGDLWIGSGPGLSPTRWQRSSGRFRAFGPADGLPRDKGGVTVFRDDASGGLWMGYYYGGVARHRDGRFDFFDEAAGLPAGGISDILVDRKGRIWIATQRGGVARIDDPTLAQPRIKAYTMAAGLSSDDTRCLVEDLAGHIYIGTGRGVDRLDPETGEIRRYTTADGLANSETTVAFRDRRGALWFGTLSGLSVLMPEADVPLAPPPVFIMGVNVGGSPREISEVGENSVLGLEVESDCALQVDFVGVSFAAGEVLRYQYRMEGLDSRWSPPTDQRTVHYAALPAGSYQLAVRSVRSNGVVSETPAVVAITVRPPLWRRSWFLGLAAVAAVLTAYAAHRLRVSRVLELERVRTRIATDLHDDIGSSLSRMAILSEVVRRDITESHPEAGRTVAKIADAAREMVDATGDIVWSIDPRQDDVDHLVVRVREFAAGVFDAKGIAWTLDAGPEIAARKISPEQRRQLFLIFKEAMHNVVRHAACARVAMRFAIEGHRLLAEIRDDGCGFAPEPSPSTPGRRGGHGLGSMRARAVKLGGRLDVQTAPGRGTHLTLSAPL
jgi:ligand-binding sensor domain-containing protein/signal transduction histidine kinase